MGDTTEYDKLSGLKESVAELGKIRPLYKQLSTWQGRPEVYGRSQARKESSAKLRRRNTRKSTANPAQVESCESGLEESCVGLLYAYEDDRGSGSGWWDDRTNMITD